MFYYYKEHKYHVSIEKFYIELTTSCNAKCPYCYNSAGIKTNNINIRQLENFLQNSLVENVTKIHLSGGEPLLHPDYFSLVDFLSKTEKHILTVSNAFLITEKYLNSYMKNHVLQLTIDSMLEEEHDRTRGRGNYRKVMDAIEYCEKSGFSANIYLRHNIIRGNQNDLRKFVEFAIEKGIGTVSMSVLRNMGRAKGHSNILYDYKNNLSQLLQLNNEMAQLRQEYGEYIKISSNRFENQSGCPFNRPQDYHMSPRIDCYGNLYICESFDGDDNIVGNVFETSIDEIFASKKFEWYMETLFERQENNNECQRCLFKGLCTGGCPADQYMEAGNYLKSTSQCNIIRESFKNNLLKKGVL